MARQRLVRVRRTLQHVLKSINSLSMADRVGVVHLVATSCIYWISETLHQVSG